MVACDMASRKTKKPKKQTVRSGRAAEAKFIAEVERAHWPEIKRKLDQSLESLAQGKGRKWNLDRFLAEAEKRRRSKLAAE